MTRRFWVGLALTLPVFVLEMGGHLADLHMLIGQQASNWLQLLLATPVVLWAGWPFFERGWASRHKPQPQHVHADRARHRRRLALQRGRHGRARPVPGRLARPGWRGRGLFRGRGGHHRPRAAGPGAGAARPRADQRRHPGAARPRAQDRAPPARRRRRRGGAARPGACGRPAARAAGREGAGRRRGRRGGQRRRRVHGHRRADAGREAGRAPRSSAAR